MLVWRQVVHNANFVVSVAKIESRDGTLNHVAQKGDHFDAFADCAVRIHGTSRAVIVFCTCILIWLAVGKPLNFSDAWQLLINTPTTIETTFIGLLIIYNQLKDSKAIHAKLDALVVAVTKHNELLHLEDRPLHEIEEIRDDGS
jgi:low affinity Fe/Cu permease